MSAILQLSRDSDAGLALLGAALVASPECMAIVESGVILYANPAFEKLFGYSGLRLTGAALSDFIPGDRACTRKQNCLRTQQECGYPCCDFETERLDGAPLQLEAQCSPLTFEQRDLLIINVRDISHSERRRVVRESDERFRVIVGEAAIGILQCTTDGRVLESNPAAQRILGYNNDELRGMSFRDFIHADDSIAGSLLFDGHSQPCQKELRYERKDRTKGWARLTISLVRGPDAKPAFAILMIEDVTEYKRAEQQVRESQRMEAIGRLVGGVAHDFNNLLTGIMLYSDLIKAGLTPESRRLTAYIDEIRLASEHGGAMIQQLLSVAKRQVVEPRVLSLNEIVSGMQNLIARLIGEHIEFRTDLDPGLRRVRMDPAQVQQILLNLAINARDAMPDGGTIVVRTRNVPSSSKEVPGFVELTVRDDGCGMSPEILAQVFEPFFTTKAADHGNGLGLTTVHSIVRESGGSIHIKSQPSSGTCVTVLLPAVPVQTLPIATEVARTSINGNETILLVEDNEAVRSAAQRILRDCGYRVMEASNGREALHVFEEHSHEIQLLLTDLALPGEDGHQIAERIHQISPSLPVIFTSGYQRSRSHPQVAEPVVIFRKPFAGEALVRKIRQVLDDGVNDSNRSGQQKRKVL